MNTNRLIIASFHAYVAASCIPLTEMSSVSHICCIRFRLALVNMFHNEEPNGTSSVAKGGLQTAINTI
jgi:hypothetical protein